MSVGGILAIVAALLIVWGGWRLASAGRCHGRRRQRFARDWDVPAVTLWAARRVGLLP